MSNNIKKYELSEEKPQLVSEPVATYAVPQQHETYMHVSMTHSDDSAIEIPKTYEEAMSMDLLDLEDAKKELLKYIDELAEEFNLS